jgi:hypothetical protein
MADTKMFKYQYLNSYYTHAHTYIPTTCQAVHLPKVYLNCFHTLLLPPATFWPPRYLVLEFDNVQKKKKKKSKKLVKFIPVKI